MIPVLAVVEENISIAVVRIYKYKLIYREYL